MLSVSSTRGNRCGIIADLSEEPLSLSFSLFLYPSCSLALSLSLSFLVPFWYGDLVVGNETIRFEVGIIQGRVSENRLVLYAFNG